MKKILFTLLACLCFQVQATTGHAEYISHKGSAGDFTLAAKGQVAALYVDQNDHKGLLRAVNNLQQDLQKVTGSKPELVHQLTEAPLVIIGTLGHSELVDQLVAKGKVDVSAIKEQWEGFQIQLVEQPFAGVKQALVLIGADKRGSIFAAYDLAEKIGVSPWYWWADVPVKKADSLYVKANTLIQDWPEVKYRGIFLNDEAPALTGWVHEKFGNYNAAFYEHVFELLLRLKANFLWPAMWNNAFAMDDPQNPILADEMGIVMSNSHHEPMMRADKEWNRVGEGKWDYSVNAENLYKFWQEGAERHKNLESIFTLGMRGQQDEPMSEDENIGLLERIVHDQRQILKDTFGEDKLSDVPQVWALYKEVQSYYENGMRVPDDVTLLWSDDNWGNLRRLPTKEERDRVGGAGVYYHFDYVGGPRSYRWMNTVPIAKIWEQMQLAYKYNARRIWLTNVGDLKPMEYPIDFFLRLAWDPTDYPKESIPEYGVQWATQQFGPEHAEAIEEIMTGYTRHNGRRKPELMGPENYSQLVYQEAERVSAELQALVYKAEQLYGLMPESHKDAFFQLVLHPIKAVQNVYELNNNLAKNRLYAAQERATANEYADKARYWFEQDAELEKQYHTLADGRWNHFMAQPHIGYSNWNNPPADVLPTLHINNPQAVSDMGIAIEGSAYAWPQVSGNSWPHSSDLNLNFDFYGQQQRYIEVFNKGTVPFDFNAKISAPWIKLSEVEGQVDGVKKLWVSIDWQQLKAGEHSGHIRFRGAAWGHADITISAFKPASEKVSGFVEADGYVSMEAASAKVKGNSADGQWQEIPLHGRTQSSMSAFMPVDTNFADPAKAPYLEYDVHLFSTGDVEVQTIVAPSLNFVPGRGLRFAIGFDEEVPQMVDILADNSHRAWQESVKDGVRYAISKHHIAKPGAKKLRIYMVDPAVTIQKVIINTGELKPSYLGPPPSRKL